MARRRAEFHFAVQNLLVHTDVLGTELEFERGGFRVEVWFPAAKYRAGRDFGGINYRISDRLSGPARAVDKLRVFVVGDGPRGEDTEASIVHLRKSFQIAEAVVGELIEWSRIDGQSWLGLHGQLPKLVGEASLEDETSCTLFGYNDDGLPYREPDTVDYEIKSSLDQTRAFELRRLLSDGRPSLPFAETLLADALYFIQLNPPDSHRAVLIAAIACEVKVKDALRKKTPTERLPLVNLILENPRDWSMAAQALYDKVTKAAFGRSLKDENRILFKEIGELFELRNKIAHKGEKPDQAESKRLVRAGRRAFAWLDEP
ncbi:MAG: hypothetical protein ACKV2U_26155 [Bryobacteraceae bacterium]